MQIENEWLQVYLKYFTNLRSLLKYLYEFRSVNWNF